MCPLVVSAASRHDMLHAENPEKPPSDLPELLQHKTVNVQVAWLLGPDCSVQVLRNETIVLLYEFPHESGRHVASFYLILRFEMKRIN